MRKYCKAYPLHQLRQFAGWKESGAQDQSALTDDTIVYLWDDFAVVESPVLEQGNLFDDITPAWQAFCQQTLKFAIPEDLQYAYKS